MAEQTARIQELEEEVARLRQRLLTAAGDDLCRLSQEEIKELSAGTVKIPPKEEFLASCERFWQQTAKDSGVLPNCLTLAQVIAENTKLEQQHDQLRATLSQVMGELTQPEMAAVRHRCEQVLAATQPESDSDTDLCPPEVAPTAWAEWSIEKRRKWRYQQWVARQPLIIGGEVQHFPPTSEIKPESTP
jgi:hypothetical protein